jgi:hypothetical protein
MQTGVAHRWFEGGTALSMEQCAEKRTQRIEGSLTRVAMMDASPALPLMLLVPSTTSK